MRTLIISLLIIYPFCGFAQSDALAIQQAIEIALKNNAAIKASQFEVDASRALRKTGADLGKTSVLGTFGQYNSYANDNNFTIQQTIPFTAFGSQASLNRSLLAATELKKSVTENELVYQVKQTFYQLTFVQARHDLLVQQDSIYQGFLKSASLRYKTGEANLLEQTTAETQSNEIKNQLRQNEASAIVLRTQLKTLLNSESLPEIEKTSPGEIKFDELPDTALITANPSLAYMRQQMEVTQSQKKVESAKLAPDIIIGYFNQTLIRTPDPETGIFSTASTRFTGFQLGVSIPLWFVPQNARIKSAEYNKQAARSNYRYYHIALQGQAEQAIQQFDKARNSLTYYRTSALPNAELILKQSQAAFRGGNIGYAEYLLGVRNAITIKEGYLQTLNEYNQSIIYIEFLSGNK